MQRDREFLLDILEAAKLAKQRICEVRRGGGPPPRTFFRALRGSAARDVLSAARGTC